MATEIESNYFVQNSSDTEHSNLKRKLPPSTTSDDSPTDFNIGETSEAEFEKSDLPDFSEFTVENGTIKLERNLEEQNQQNFDAFHQTYSGYLENISMTQPSDSGDNINGNAECSPSKKEKVVQGNGFNPLKTHLMSHAASPSFNSSNSEKSSTQSNPVPAHFISATGDSHSGWYEVLEVNENRNMYQNSSVQLKDEGIIKTLDKSSIPLTSGSINVPQSTSTPISSQSFLRTVPTSGFVYTPHPRSGQVLYITDPTSLTPEGTQTKAQTVSPLLMNGANMITPEAVAQIHPKILFSNSNENENAEQENTENQALKTSQKEVQLKETSMSILDSPEAVDEERESHNMKERKRRARIKEACDLMRQLVPGMSDKTDKATVFEFAARYIYFLKNFVGNAHDKDFLIKYSPY